MLDGDRLIEDGASGPMIKWQHKFQSFRKGFWMEAFYDRYYYNVVEMFERLLLTQLWRTWIILLKFDYYNILGWNEIELNTHVLFSFPSETSEMKLFNFTVSQREKFLFEFIVRK